MHAAPAENFDDVVVQRNENNSNNAVHRGESRCPFTSGTKASQQDVGEVDEPEQEGHGQARVPRPEAAPRSFGPDRTRDDHEAAEEDTDLSARDGESIPGFLSAPKVDPSRDSRDDETKVGPVRQRRVNIKDFLNHTLHAVDRGVVNRPSVENDENQKKPAQWAEDAAEFLPGRSFGCGSHGAFGFRVRHQKSYSSRM